MFYGCGYVYDLLKKELEYYEYITQKKFIKKDGHFGVTSSEIREHLRYIICFIFLFSIIFSMAGAAGSMVISPMIIDYGISPRTAISTTNFLLFLSTSNASIIYLFNVFI